MSGIEPDVTPDAGQGAKAAGRCDVLEVGCGMGVLTQFLLRRDDIVTYGPRSTRKASNTCMRIIPNSRRV